MKNKEDKPNRNVKLSYWTKQNQGNKAGTTNSNGTNEGKTLEIKNYRMKIEEKEEGALIEYNLLDLRFGRTIHATWSLDLR